MLDAAWTTLQFLLGLEADPGGPNAGQMAVRTIVVYAITLALVRLGSRRFLARASAFDVIVGIMIGSIMSRAINGSAPFFPTVLAGAVLLGMHWLLAVLAFHTGWLGSIIKGSRILLIEDGRIQEDGMRKAAMTPHDLAQALRVQAHQRDPGKVRRAYLERDGKISVVPARSEPSVHVVSVEDGVQTVRIELE